MRSTGGRGSTEYTITSYSLLFYPPRVSLLGVSNVLLPIDRESQTARGKGGGRGVAPYTPSALARAVWNLLGCCPMKTQIGLLVPVGVADLARSKALELGVSQPALFGFALRYMLDRCPPDALAKWASMNRPILGRKPAGGNGLTALQRRVHDAFDPLVASSDGAWRFDSAQVGAAAQCRPVEALGALYALQGRGLVHVEDLTPGKVDRWGRPSGLHWARVDLIPESARQRLGLT